MSGDEENSDRAERKLDPSASGRKSGLSTSQQDLLKTAIRGKVARKLEEAHPQGKDRSARPSVGEQSGSLAKPVILEAANKDGSEQADDKSMLLPGVDIARKYQDLLRKALIDPDPLHHREVIDKLTEEHLPIQTASVHLFTPVAVQLGQMWCEDDMDFVQVAVASSRLNIIVNQLVKHSRSKLPVPRNGRRIMLARTAGCTHTLGLSIVAACFDDSGWEVEGGADYEADERLMRNLNRNNYEVVGLSVGTTSAVGECRELVTRSKAASRNREIRIAIGGPAVSLDRRAFEAVGADIISASALEAVEQVNAYFQA